jgi:hypothetical protein
VGPRRRSRVGRTRFESRSAAVYCLALAKRRKGGGKGMTGGARVSERGRRVEGLAGPRCGCWATKKKERKGGQVGCGLVERRRVRGGCWARSRVWVQRG